MTMRVLCAPDKFKGSLSAEDAAAAMAEGVSRADPSIEIDRCPIADGGEGTVRVIGQSLDPSTTRFHTTEVCGPLGRAQRVKADWLMIESLPAGAVESLAEHGDAIDLEFPIAVIELAAAAGHVLVPKAQQNPMQTTTFGLGELIRLAIRAGSRSIILTVGGSATCDGACGMAQALGARFVMANGEKRDVDDAPITGGELIKLHDVDLDPLRAMIDEVSFIVACDVRNPLLGPDGAARVYAPQKGASPDEVELLERGLEHLASRIFPEIDSTIEGAGAAGGAGFGLHAFCHANIARGIEVVLDLINMSERIRHADLVLTGEGQFDAQSLFGKAVFGIAEQAKRLDRPIIALAGRIAKSMSAHDFERARRYLTSWAAIRDLPNVNSDEQAVAEAHLRLADLAEREIRRYLGQNIESGASLD